VVGVATMAKEENGNGENGEGEQVKLDTAAPGEEKK